MYAYVGNNPLSYTDPSGMIAEAGGGDGNWGGFIVAGFEALGDWLSGLGGHTPSLQNFPFPNVTPTFSVAVWDAANSDSTSLSSSTAPLLIPGLMFYAQGTASNPKANGCIANPVGNFVNLHLADAQQLAKSLGNGVSSAEVLATAGSETGYGLTGFAFAGNYFGLHGSGPEGSVKAARDGPMQKFPLGSGFLLSGKVFVNTVGPYMQPGMGQNPLKFYQILNQHGYATGNSGYPSFMVRTGKIRGPYTLVNACTGGR
jgi:hypothetical protein